MTPVQMIQKAMDLHARSVTSRMKIPMGKNLYGRWFRDMRVEFNELSLDVRKDRISRHGLTLVQLSDIHTGPYLEGPELAWVMDRVTAMDPDIIVLTGDYVNRDPAELYPCLGSLAKLKARGGVFAVLGNHDFWGDEDEVAEALEGIGITVLRNRGVDLDINETRFHLAGVDDWKEKRADLKSASRDRSDRHLSILLSHCPQMVEDAAEEGYDLVLSGHTHGMQIRLPIWRQIASRFMHNRFDHGHSRHGDTHLYISRGLGVVTLPWRYKCPPEVTRIRLKQAA
jgi:uncharacterized protein